jgi:hypothetical protein
MRPPKRAYLYSWTLTTDRKSEHTGTITKTSVHQKSVPGALGIQPRHDRQRAPAQRIRRLRGEKTQSPQGDHQGGATSKLVLYTERTVLDCVYGFFRWLCFLRGAIAMLFSWGHCCNLEQYCNWRIVERSTTYPWRNALGQRAITHTHTQTNIISRGEVDHRPLR